MKNNDKKNAKAIWTWLCSAWTVIMTIYIIMSTAATVNFFEGLTSTWMMVLISGSIFCATALLFTIAAREIFYKAVCAIADYLNNREEV